MKKITTKILMIAALAVAFASCGKDNGGDPDPAVKVTGVTLNKTATTIAVGGTETLVPTVAPADADNQNVTWSSNNAAATVSASGVVTGVSAGTATITVTTVDGSKKATCAVTVSATTVSVTGVTLNKATASIEVGGTETLVPTIAPAGATNQNVMWNSNNNAAATVSASGVVTGVSVGTATITVTTADGGKTADCVVTVGGGVAEQGVVINGVRWAETNVNAPGTFAASPESFGMFYQWNRELGWSSSDPLTSSPGGAAWNSSDASGDSWAAANDPCPEGWRVPTLEEFEKLIDATKVDNEWAIQNGVNGCRFTDKISSVSIFLPAVGLRSNTDGALAGQNSLGFYWTAAAPPLLTDRANLMQFSGGTAARLGSNDRPIGFSVRCVKK